MAKTKRERADGQPQSQPQNTRFASLAVFACVILKVLIVSPDLCESRLNHYPETCQLPKVQTNRYYSCGENWCLCTRTRADCSRRHGKLTFIPKLPLGILYLNFAYNNLTVIPDGFFKNVTDITSLSLSSNQITNISDGAFASFRRLHVLFLDHNFNMTDKLLEPVSRIQTLRCVDFAHGKLKALPNKLLNGHLMSSLEGLHFFENNIGIANLSLLETLPRLQTIDWGGNDVSLYLPGRLLALKNLYLYDNRIGNFPVTCDENSTSFYPRLKLLKLRNNAIHAIPATLCLNELETLDLSGNVLPVLYTDMFSSTRFPRLVYLYLEYMSTHVQEIQDYAFRNRNLRKISLMYNRIQFAEQYVSTNSFSESPNLTTLQMSHNFFSGISDQKMFRLFENLTNLVAIYMGGTTLERVTPYTFANFPHLEILLLYNNKIAEIPDGTFDGNPRLRELQLNDNQIRTIGEKTFSEANRQGLKRLDLSGNPFSCDCDLRWFSQWMRDNRSLFYHSRSFYNCSNLHKVLLTSFHMIDQACLLRQVTSQFVITSMLIIIVTGTLVSTLFRYRWHLRLLLYETFRGGNDLRRRRLEMGRFDYDVFVSYAANDLPWIRQNLMPELEGRQGLRLCLHERDFLPGNQIVDNIVESVQSSKKIMMIFSNHFMRSQWCQFELDYCLRYVMDYDDVLIIACLDDVASRDLTPTMMAVMKTTTYIQWAEDPDVTASFWGRLRLALQEVAADAL